MKNNRNICVFHFIFEGFAGRFVAVAQLHRGKFLQYFSQAISQAMREFKEDTPEWQNKAPKFIKKQ